MRTQTSALTMHYMEGGLHLIQGHQLEWTDVPPELEQEDHKKHQPPD